MHGCSNAASAHAMINYKAIKMRDYLHEGRGGTPPPPADPHLDSTCTNFVILGSGSGPLIRRLHPQTASFFLRTRIPRVCEAQAFLYNKNSQPPLLAAAQLRGKFGARKRCVCCAARGRVPKVERAPPLTLPIRAPVCSLQTIKHCGEGVLLSARTKTLVWTTFR